MVQSDLFHALSRTERGREGLDPKPVILGHLSCRKPECKQLSVADIGVKPLCGASPDEKDQVFQGKAEWDTTCREKGQLNYSLPPSTGIIRAALRQVML